MVEETQKNTDATKAEKEVKSYQELIDMIKNMSWVSKIKVSDVLNEIELYLTKIPNSEREKDKRPYEVLSLLRWFFVMIKYQLNKKGVKQDNKIKYIKRTINKIKEIIDIVSKLEEFKNNKEILELLNKIIERLEEILKELENNEDDEDTNPEPVPPKPVPPVPPEEESNFAYAWFLLKEDPANPGEPLEPTVNNMNNALLIQGWRRCNENEDDVALVLNPKGKHKNIKELIRNYQFVGLCVTKLGENNRPSEDLRWAHKPFLEAIKHSRLRREFSEEGKERQKLKEKVEKEEKKLGGESLRWNNPTELKAMENYLDAMKKLKGDKERPLTDKQIEVLSNYIEVYKGKKEKEYAEALESIQETFRCETHNELIKKILSELRNSKYFPKVE